MFHTSLLNLCGYDISYPSPLSHFFGGMLLTTADSITSTAASTLATSVTACMTTSKNATHSRTGDHIYFLRIR